MINNNDMNCYVYILNCDNKSFYTGLTNNVERRLKEHNRSKKGYTAKFRKKEVIFLYKLDSRKSARRLEIYIKSVGAKSFMLKYEKSLKLDKRTIKYYKQKLLTT